MLFVTCIYAQFVNLNCAHVNLPGTNISFRTNLPCHARQVVNDFDLPDIIFDLSKISYNMCLKVCIVYLGLKHLLAIFISVLFLGIWAIRYRKMCLVFKKSACPFGHVKTKVYLPESPFFQNSLTGASRLVLMPVPACLFLDFVNLMALLGVV